MKFATAAMRGRVGAALLAGAVCTCAGTAGAMSILVGATAFGTFNIELDLSGTTVADADRDAFDQAFDEAALFWENRVLGYQSQEIANIVGDLEITVGTADLGGPFGTLAVAGPTGGTDPFLTGGLVVATRGFLDVDTADISRLLAEDRFDDLVRHEMAHVMGFGTLWEFNGLLSDNMLEYVGVEGVAAYQREFDPTATFVPVEDEGGPGTAGGHWDEQLFLEFADPSDVTAAFTGNPELMTGFLNAPTELSLTTLASFGDLGYVVADSTDGTIPLPPSALLLMSAVAALGAAGHRTLRRAAFTRSS